MGHGFLSQCTHLYNNNLFYIDVFLNTKLVQNKTAVKKTYLQLLLKEMLNVSLLCLRGFLDCLEQQMSGFA